MDGILQGRDLSVFRCLLWNAASCPELCAIVDEVRWAKVLAVNMLLGSHTSPVPIPFYQRSTRFIKEIEFRLTIVKWLAPGYTSHRQSQT